MDTARMLMFAGYAIIGVRWSFLFVHSCMDLMITPSLVLGVHLGSRPDHARGRQAAQRQPKWRTT